MPLAKCERCEKLFSKFDSPICPACAPEEEKDHEAVRLCIADHPDLNVETIAELSGVSVQCVMRMIDQGLVVTSLSKGTMKCGKCGAPAISASKKLCSSCLEEMNRNVAKQRSQLGEIARKQVQIGEHQTVRQAIEAKRKT